MDKLIIHIKRLLASGWKQSEIAEKANTTQPTINRIIKGIVDCRYSIGKRIEKIKPKNKAA
ncbi:MAG: helix-turn-helix domain-containing protein [Mariprofundaceae bacterium]|nr:helix-turn-helix domain-containing protein [Mariprofundaceae bacterium]